MRGHTDLSGPQFCTGSLHDLKRGCRIRRDLRNQPQAIKRDSNVRNTVCFRGRNSLMIVARDFTTVIDCDDAIYETAVGCGV